LHIKRRSGRRELGRATDGPGMEIAPYKYEGERREKGLICYEGTLTKGLVVLHSIYEIPVAAMAM
jgi:hypothetical protein